MNKKVLKRQLESIEFVMRELRMESNCATVMRILETKRATLLVKLKLQGKDVQETLSPLH